MAKDKIVIEKIPMDALREMNQYWKEIDGAAYGDAKVKHPWFLKVAAKSTPYHPVRVVFTYPDGSTGMRYMEIRKSGEVLVSI